MVWVCTPGRLSDQHGPVQLPLDVCVPGAAGVDEGVDGDQDEALSIQLPDLDGQLPDRGQTKHRRHRHLWREGRADERRRGGGREGEKQG